ncbi:SusD/RagB family nutrient-binding outer membrane lipoprotein [Chryseosolibacter indicus]|uniref:SusD/RagB family nutrient-binding outer membrane lipoprotein n=1 Tax=Chryseosolibacter indicus TaxID=2782351 RepID=A0ABS5VMT7_9BACT|nr:SusD/RagB family nutrient-binding outer membrane lipoprotein [Chryseosolibacter indicus]MBT1702155.1 SusD/RagB family nutrient-binding outer membrane lipoprotein [Chryseosolibacter indicus]
MKFKNIYILIISFMLLVFSGCTDGFEDLNTDKNNASEDATNPVYQLTRAQLEYSGNSDFSFEVWRVNIIYAGMMMQHLASTSWYSGDKYQQNNAFSSAYFDVAYNDQVKYVVDLIELTKDKPQYANLYQIGRIMRVMIFHRITDIYGDVPYSEAGLGYIGRKFTPSYDTQEFIYLNMLEELEQAAAALDLNGDRPGLNDLIYGAKPDVISKWKKLAYSLMLRLSMRLTKVKEDIAKQYAEKAFAGGVFTSNEDNAYIVHDATGGRNTVNRNSNILGGEWNATDFGVTDPTKYKNEVFLSKTFIDYLKNNNDPRLQYTAVIKKTGSSNPADQVGLPNGLDTNKGDTDVTSDPNYPGDLAGYSTIRGDVFLSLTGPTFFITYAQTELLLAEAKQRGFAVGAESAEQHYNNGVRAAMEQYAQYNSVATIPALTIQNYLTAHPYNGSYEQINTQYWVASFMDWYETWANWRRSGFPALVPVNYTGNATNGQIPRRMLYPATEASVNAENYSRALDRQGANNFMTRVWWDQ